MKVAVNDSLVTTDIAERMPMFAFLITTCRSLCDTVSALAVRHVSDHNAFDTIEADPPIN